MSIIDLLKLALNNIIGFYFCAVLSFLITSVGTDRKNYLLEAFSPIKLINEMMAGNWVLIEITIWIFGLFRIIIYLRTTDADYLNDAGWSPWIEKWWNWWNR